MTYLKEVESTNIQISRRIGSSLTSKGKGATVARISLKPLDTVSEASQMTEESQVDSCLSAPMEHITASSNFAWAKRKKQILPPRLSGLRTSRSHRLQQTSEGIPRVVLQAEAFLDSETQEKDQLPRSRVYDEIHNRGVQEHKMWHNQLESFDAAELYDEPQELSTVREYKP